MPPSLPLYPTRHRRTAPRPGSLAATLALPAALLALLLLAACGGDSEQRAEAPPPSVEALPARVGSLPLERRVNGVVRADNQVVVRPEVSGRVVEVLVRNGDSVRRGQELVRLEPRGLRDQVRQADADVRLARAAAAEARAEVQELEAEVTRTRKLAAEDLVSDMELETLEARLDAAQAAAESAAARVDQADASADESRFGLGRAVVRAPSAGRVGRRQVEVGTIVDPGTPLFTLGDLDDLVVEVPLTEAMLSEVREGQPVEVRPRGGGTPFRATLSRISPFLEPGSFTTTGEVDVEGADGLRPGMFVTVDIRYGESERATLLPATSLWEDPATGLTGVYLVVEDQGLVEPSGPQPRQAGRGGNGGGGNGTGGDYADVPDEARRVEFTPVEVLAEGAGLVGVAGVAEGAWVVTVGQHLLDRQREDRARGDVTGDAAGDGDAAGEPGESTFIRGRVRPTSWARVMELQSLQREDLLEGFVDKQRKLARVLGAELPANESAAKEALRRAEAGAGAPGGGDSSGGDAGGDPGGSGPAPTPSPGG